MTELQHLRAQLARLDLRHPVPTRGPSELEIERLTKAGRWPLSESVVLLLSDFGGSRPPVGREFSAAGYALADFLGFGAPGQRDAARQIIDMKSRIPKPWIPWSRDGMGNYFITTPDGEKVGVWDHELHDGNRLKVKDLGCDLNGFFDMLNVEVVE